MNHVAEAVPLEAISGQSQGQRSAMATSGKASDLAAHTNGTNATPAAAIKLEEEELAGKPRPAPLGEDAGPEPKRVKREGPAGMEPAVLAAAAAVMPAALPSPASPAMAVTPSSRLQTLKTQAHAESEATSSASSPSSSRQSTPTIDGHTPAHVGGAKRKGDGHETLPRNIDRVYYGEFDIKTWYYSPYQLDDDPATGSAAATMAAKANAKGKNKAKGKARALDENTTSSSLDDGFVPPPSPSTTAKGKSRALDAPNQGGPNGNLASSDPKVSSLWICEGCFKYMRTYPGWNAHKRECTYKHPPGRKVWQRGSLALWEVDGLQEKLYAQNLSLFGKLFIDHKTIFFDVAPFLFYVVTDSGANWDLVLGYFSKEKKSYDDYNLACIVTFPPYQKRSYGTVMMEYSYYLSTKAGVLGTPERPLSELGFKGYVSFWSSIVLRTLALAFNEDDPDVMHRLLPQAAGAAATSQTSPSKHANGNAASPGRTTTPVSVPRWQKKAAVRIRALLLGVADPTASAVNEAELSQEERDELKKLRRSAIGWAGELPPALAARLASFGSSPKKSSGMNESSDSTPPRTTPNGGITVVANGRRFPRAATQRGAADAGNSTAAATATAATTTAAAAAASSLDPLTQSALDLTNPSPFALSTTLERLSQATGLRPDDAAFALEECGLLKWRLDGVPDGIANVAGGGRKANADVANASGEGSASASASASTSTPGPFILITREAVRKAILEKKVKRPLLDLQYLLLL